MNLNWSEQEPVKDKRPLTTAYFHCSHFWHQAHFSHRLPDEESLEKSLWGPEIHAGKLRQSSHSRTNNHHHSRCGFKHNTECSLIFKSFNNLLKKECKSNRSFPPKWICLIFKVMTDVTKILQTFLPFSLHLCTLSWQLILFAVNKWVSFCIPYIFLYIYFYIIYIFIYKKSSQQKILWYESLESKPTSMKCTPLGKFRKANGAQLKCVYTNMQGLGQSRLSEVE